LYFVFLSIVVLCFRLVYPILPVSLDFSFLIAPSVFSNVYLEMQLVYRQKKEKRNETINLRL